MKALKIAGTIAAILVVVGIAWATRWKALTTLNIDYDEDDYMRAAQEYTALIRSGDWAGFMDTNYRPEHPPLAKIIMGVSLLADPERPVVPDKPTSAEPNKYLPRDLLRTDRVTDAIFGTVTVGLLAIVNPLAGLLLAIHAWTIKYVSQIMLEAIPALFSLVCVLTYLLWKRQKKSHFTGWLAASAIFLGLTAASKYLYCVVALAILADWLIDSHQEGKMRHSWGKIALWVLIGVAVFFLFDPYLWPDPIGRLKESLLYHASYSTGASEVSSANYPLWQQFVWLSTSPRVWQSNAMYFSIDPFIAILAVFGVAGAWKKYRVFALWLGIAMFFLLIWPTKWPQYLVTISVPLCLAASVSLDTYVFAPVFHWVKGLGRKKERAVPAKSEFSNALPWLIPGAIVFIIFTILPLLYQIGVSLTDFNSVSLKDGLSGGIWREVWGGITGQIGVVLQNFPYTSKTVHYQGLINFQPILNFLSQQQTLFYDIFWTVTSVGLQTLLGLSIALILQQHGLLLKRGWQILFLLPWAIPELIGALMWLNVFDPTTGWLALAAQKLGTNTVFGFPIQWTQTPSLWFGVLLIAGVWYGFPFMMFASSAGLKMIPTEQFDAAEIDGANSFQTFRYITWPLVFPLLAPAIIIRGIFAFNQFYLFQVFNIWLTLSGWSYNFFNTLGGYARGQYAISAVINVITIMILIGFVLLFNRASKADKGVTYA